MGKSGDFNEPDCQRALDNPFKIAGSDIFKPFAGQQVQDPLVYLSIGDKSCNIPVEIRELLLDLIRRRFLRIREIRREEPGDPLSPDRIDLISESPWFFLPRVLLLLERSSLPFIPLTFSVSFRETGNVGDPFPPLFRASLLGFLFFHIFHRYFVPQRFDDLLPREILNTLSPGSISDIIDLGDLEEFLQEEISSPVPIKEAQWMSSFQQRSMMVGEIFVPSTPTAFLIPIPEQVDHISPAFNDNDGIRIEDIRAGGDLVLTDRSNFLYPEALADTVNNLRCCQSILLRKSR